MNSPSRFIEKCKPKRGGAAFLVSRNKLMLELFEVVSTIVMFAPFLLLLFLANFADQARTSENPNGGFGLAIASYVLVILGYVLLFLMGIVYFLLGLSGAEISGLEESFLRRNLRAWARMWLPSLIGVLLLIPVLRRIASRIIPIDPNSRVHAVSLSLSMIILIQLFVMMSIGLDAIANMKVGTEDMTANPAPALWAQNLMFLFMSLIGVGLFVRRDFSSALRRLGIVKPTLRQVLIGIGSGLLLVGIASIIVMVGEMVGVTVDKDVEKLTEQLLGPLTQSVFGVLTMGLAAGLGEEALFRGALQPRFGLILTTLLFTLLHGNYGLTLSTFVVFLVGLALGLLRNRYNTTTTMIVHATYNITLGVLANLSPNLF